MTPSELIAAGERLYGPRWRQPLAWALEIDISTLRRWINGETAIPGPVKLAVKLLLARVV